MSEMEELFIGVSLPASATLDWINNRVELYEKAYGPLVEMKLDNAMSLLRFRILASKPDKFAKVAKQVAGKPQIPDGAKLVASGRLMIEGEQVLCAATRGP